MRINEELKKFEKYLNINVDPKNFDMNIYYGGLSEKAPKEAREAYEKSKKVYMDALKKGIKL